MDIEEIIFIMYREDLKNFVQKYRNLFDNIGYLNVPTSTCNSLLPLEDALEQVNYTIKCEERSNNEY